MVLGDNVADGGNSDARDGEQGADVTPSDPQGPYDLRVDNVGAIRE